MKRVFLVAGPPGVGKTTVLLRVVDLLRARGLKVGGMVTREVRDKIGARVGFEVQDLASGEWGWLARACRGAGPRIGRYLVDITTLNRVGASGILNAAVHSDVIVVDEVGPMELLSEEFRHSVKRAVESGKPTVATVHFRSADPLILALKGREDAEPLIISVENRGSLPGIIFLRVLSLLE